MIGMIIGAIAIATGAGLIGVVSTLVFYRDGVALSRLIKTNKYGLLVVDKGNPGLPDAYEALAVGTMTMEEETLNNANKLVPITGGKDD